MGTSPDEKRWAPRWFENRLTVVMYDGNYGDSTNPPLTALPKQSASASILQFCHVYRNPVADRSPSAHADDDGLRRLGRPGIADADFDFDADPDSRPSVRRGAGRIEPSWRRRDAGAESN